MIFSQLRAERGSTRKFPIISVPHNPPQFMGPSTSKEINTSGYKLPPPPPPNISTPLDCIEMNSTFYDVLKLKKAIKFQKYFDEHCYVACFETLFFSPVVRPPEYRKIPL